MPRLPNWERAVIPPAKIRNYLLFPDHPRGRSKAIFFASLGYEVKAWTRLASDLRTQCLPMPASLSRTTEFGPKYVIYATLVGPNGTSAEVVTVWILRWGQSAPCLVTAYPGGKR